MTVRVPLEWLSAKPGMRNTGPTYYKDGNSVRYQRRDLIDYMRARRVKATTAA